MVLNSRSEHGVLTSVIPATVSRRSFNFTRGDFIGIMNPNQKTDRLSMLYHNNSGPTVYFQEELSSEPLLKLNIYPLLAVETGTIAYCNRVITAACIYSIYWHLCPLAEPENCTSRFLSLDILRSLLIQDIMTYQEPGLYIIPKISLACSIPSTINRERVEGVLAGELLDTGDTNQLLTVTWWQQIQDSEKEQAYNLTATATITELKPTDGRPNVYSFILNMSDDRLNVIAGNVLGIRINTRIFKPYYDASRSGIMNHRVLTRFQSNPSGVPSTVNVTTDTNAIICGAPLLSFGERGRA